MMNSYKIFRYWKSALRAIKAVIKNENTIIISEKGIIKKLAIMEMNEN